MREASEKDFRQRTLRLEKKLGTRRVSEITPKDVERALENLQEDGLKHRSILNYRNTLAEVLSHAKAARYTPSNPMDFIPNEVHKKLVGEREGDAQKDINKLTVTEVRSLMNAAYEIGDLSLLATIAEVVENVLSDAADSAQRGEPH